MITMREFTKNDWNAYAGATPFADGSEPWIGEIEVGDVYIVVIVAGEGVTIESFTSDGDPIAMWSNDRLTKEEGLAYARALSGSIQTDKLIEDGFYNYTTV